MTNSEVNEIKLEAGEYCQKGSPRCFCKVGWPYERQCPDCRDSWGESFRDSYCICPPIDKYKLIKQMTKEDREEIYQFAMKRSQEILSGVDDD